MFVHQKWTPYLMMLTLYNSISELNEFADEATYRLTGKVEMDGRTKHFAFHHAGLGRDADARAHGAGRHGGATSSTGCT